MAAYRTALFFGLFFACTTLLHSQRQYKAASVLATGNWYKISIQAEGVYKVDAAFLSSLGISGAAPSAQIRVFARGNGMLPERPGDSRIDDLEEVAIDIQDGGDGNFSAPIIFFFMPMARINGGKIQQPAAFAISKTFIPTKLFILFPLEEMANAFVAKPAHHLLLPLPPPLTNDIFTNATPSIFYPADGNGLGKNFQRCPGGHLAEIFRCH
jgi:hypothetical protein